MANSVIPCPGWRKYIWGVSNGLEGTPRTWWIRFEINEHDLKNPLQRAQEIREDALDMFGQLLAKEQVEEEGNAFEQKLKELIPLPFPDAQRCTQSQESEPK